MLTTITEQVLTHHIQAVKDRDLEAIALDYAEDAVIISVTSNAEGKIEKTIIKGKKAVRDVFQSVFNNILTEGSSLEFINQVVDGEVAYITWSATSNTYTIPCATDTFVIKNGKIKVQTGFTVLQVIG